MQLLNCVLSWVRKICWRRERLPTPVFWPEEFHGLYSPWGSQILGHNWVAFTFTSSHFSHAWLFATPWTVAMLFCPWDFPGKNTGVGFHALLQGIFQPRNQTFISYHILNWQVGSLPLVPPGKPWEKYTLANLIYKELALNT